MNKKFFIQEVDVQIKAMGEEWCRKRLWNMSTEELYLLTVYAGREAIDKAHTVKIIFPYNRSEGAIIVLTNISADVDFYEEDQIREQGETTALILTPANAQVIHKKVEENQETIMMYRPIHFFDLFGKILSREER